MRSLFLTIFLTAIFSLSCKKDEKFPDLGSAIVSPTDVAVDPSEKYFYALNTDYPRDYNQGSLVALTTDGVKVSTTYLPRLGRSLTVAGNTLIITFSSSGDSPQKVMLYDITKPEAPQFVKEFSPDDCNPINAIAKASYSYWAVSCSNGKLFAGDLSNPLINSTLNFVRAYSGVRHALHIDTTRNLLLAFTTDWSDQRSADQHLDDAQSYDEQNGSVTNTPNGIPDAFESTKIDRANKIKRAPYQFVVYDLKNAHDKGWPQKEYNEYVNELHWMYFNLSNSDGSPDVAETSDKVNNHYYRTNFWAAKPDPQDGNVFYLSQRGSADSKFGGSQNANSIIKVKIIGDLTSSTLTTEETLSFERVYGFKGELDPGGRQYPGDFAISMVQGKPLLVVNHFRDLVNWPGQPYFSIATKVIGENHWFAETSSTSSNKSYFQVALTSSGRAIAANFYGNSLILLDATPGVGITELATGIR